MKFQPPMPERSERKPLLTLGDVAQMAKEAALSSGGHSPTLIAEGQQQTVITVVEPIGASFAERERQLFLLGYLLAQQGVVGVLQQVFFISEAWMSLVPDGKAPDVLPSQDPQRKEVLIVTQYIPKPRKIAMLVYEMQRDANAVLQALTVLPEFEAQTKLDAHSPLLEAFALGFLGSAFLTRK